MSTIPPPTEAHRASKEDFLRLLLAYVRLLTARYEAVERGEPTRTRPLSVVPLVAAGAHPDVLSWMHYQGHVEHLRWEYGHEGRPAYRLVDSVVLTTRSGFVLTDAGLEFGEQFVAEVLLPGEEGGTWKVPGTAWSWAGCSPTTKRMGGVSSGGRTC